MMANAVGISVSSVQRIWRAHGLQPHRVRQFKLSRDPEFVPKLRHIVGLYVDPPAHAIVLSVDEKSQIQALDRTPRGLPLNPAVNRERTAMKHCAGLDVSVKETAICIVDETGKVVREAKVTTEPEAIVALLNAAGFSYARVGLEAGPMSQWVVGGLLEVGLPVVCVETRHMKAALKAQQVNKSDRNDARGIAQMMRVGLYKAVHVKTLVSQQERMLLTSRKLLLEKLQDIENELRGTLRNFGLRVGVVSAGHFEARVRELAMGHPPLEAIIAPLLACGGAAGAVRTAAQDGTRPGTQ
jgi:hypothetical protein